MKIHHDIAQGSEEWFKIRSGIPTASEFGKILTPAKMEKSKQWEKYLYTLAGERIIGTTVDSFESQWMSRGKELEAEARNVYQMINEIEIEQVGFITADNDKYGCSPDGLINDLSRGLEIKCPAMHTHIDYLLKNDIPREYVLQIQGSMLITGYSEWEFFSYYPGLKEFIIVIKRNDKLLDRLKILLEEFCEELDTITEKLRGMDG